MTDILLSTLNARYLHSAFGLRYLWANLGDLQARAEIVEFTIQQRPQDIVEQLLARQAKIIGFGVYIWNVREITEIVALLKRVAPDVIIILGGPEISYETEQQVLAEWADYVICGAAEVAFAQLCAALLRGEKPAPRIRQADFVTPTQLQLPYAAYTETDIAQRVIYVEASRGCPFRCEFCLSALDKTAYGFELEKFLAAMDELWQRGARRFKFVDRTFNLKIEHSAKILEFFLARLDAQTFLHFELIPDHLPERLQQLMQRFPPGSLQFEIGVQSFNSEVQQRISRKQDNLKTAANLRFLREQTAAHIHADLIVGLPGEGLASFGAGFDTLYALRPHEIQVGILKRLRGAPLSRHDAAWEMRYNPYPPYNIVSNRLLDFATLQRLSRFARYWDLIGNSGRFAATLPLLLAQQPFARFLQFSDWLYAASRQTHKIALDKLFDFLYQGMKALFALAEEEILTALRQDFAHTGLRRRPHCLRNETDARPAAQSVAATPPRQARHLRGA